MTTASVTTKTAAEQKVQASAEFRMPAVTLGEMVLHYLDKGSAPSAAIVTDVGSRTITVAVVPTHQRNCSPFDGVRHRLDPDLSENDRNGCWDYTVTGTLLRQLGDKLSEPSSVLSRKS